MDLASDAKTREFETFLSFAAAADSEAALAVRAFHVLAEFRHADFMAVADGLDESGAAASFAFLGRDVERQAETIESVDRAGHEVVLHGHRHVGFASLSYETAMDDLSTGMAAIEDATGITPRGFFAPFRSVSDGTLEAAAELGLEWVLGIADGPVPAGVDLVQSVYPHDTRLLEAGDTPEEAFASLTEAAADDGVFLFHPNLLEYYDATAAFWDWVEAIGPVTVETHLADGGVGVVLDCLQPLRVE